MTPEREEQLLENVLKDIRHNRIQLPTLPEVAIRVRRLLEDPRITAAQVAKAITIDAPLSSRLLRVANSPIYRGSVPIENIRTAIARLGHKLVHSLVTSLVMVQLFQPKVTEEVRVRLRQAWSHSAHVAALSHVIAQKFTRLEPDEALLAGLIHDIGVLPLLMYAETVPYLSADKEGLNELVNSLHPRVGKVILETWRFPANLIKVAAEHEDLDRNGPSGPDYVDLVIVANLLSHVGTNHPLARRTWDRIPAFGKLGMTAQECMATMKDAREEVRQIQSMLTS